MRVRRGEAVPVPQQLHDESEVPLGVRSEGLGRRLGLVGGGLGLALQKGERFGL